MALAARQRSLIATRPLSPIRQLSILAVFDAYGVRSTVIYPSLSTGTEVLINDSPGHGTLDALMSQNVSQLEPSLDCSHVLLLV